MRRILIATKNAHKTSEISAILGSSWQVEDLTTHPEVPSPEETGVTFAENAAIKALAAASMFPGLVLADDSGLEVDALGGAPGVISARYAGAGANDAANRARLLRELKTFPSPARFVCCMVLARDKAVLGVFNGTVEGVIVSDERGEGGFGYDSLFVPSSFVETFAELPASTKNTLSHRARAMAEVARFLSNPTS
jgi:XTP/dITP diphosphohydrolase